LKNVIIILMTVIMLSVLVSCSGDTGSYMAGLALHESEIEHIESSNEETTSQATDSVNQPSEKTVILDAPPVQQDAYTQPDSQQSGTSCSNNSPPASTSEPVKAAVTLSLEKTNIFIDIG